MIGALVRSRKRLRDLIRLADLVVSVSPSEVSEPAREMALAVVGAKTSRDRREAAEAFDNFFRKEKT